MNGKTYWSGSGKYQVEYDAVSHIIPDRGEPDEVHAKLLTCISNLYYDHYNNGGCNWHFGRRDNLKTIYRHRAQLEETARAEGIDNFQAFLLQLRDDCNRLYRVGAPNCWKLNDRWEILADIVNLHAFNLENAINDILPENLA